MLHKLNAAAALVAIGGWSSLWRWARWPASSPRCGCATGASAGPGPLSRWHRLALIADLLAGGALGLGQW